jgi:hypothetical protein
MQRPLELRFHVDSAHLLNTKNKVEQVISEFLFVCLCDSYTGLYACVGSLSAQNWPLIQLLVPTGILYNRLISNEWSMDYMFIAPFQIIFTFI